MIYYVPKPLFQLGLGDPVVNGKDEYFSIDFTKIRQSHLERVLTKEPFSLTIGDIRRTNQELALRPLSYKLKSIKELLKHRSLNGK